MELEIANRKYEFAYHLNPDSEETEVKQQVQELEDLIAQSGGMILLSREPKRKHLSFPIRQKHYSYFGVMSFSSPGETLEKITAQMKLQNNLLRYLVTTLPEDEAAVRTLGSERMRPKMKTHEPTTGRAADKPKEPVKPEEMEKELEDVLEKI